MSTVINDYTIDFDYWTFNFSTISDSRPWFFGLGKVFREALRSLSDFTTDTWTWDDGRKRIYWGQRSFSNSALRERAEGEFIFLRIISNCMLETYLDVWLKKLDPFLKFNINLSGATLLYRSSSVVYFKYLSVYNQMRCHVTKLAGI